MCYALFSLSVPVLERIVKCNPKIQKPQPGNDSPHGAVSRIDRQRRILHEKRILVPEQPDPRSTANKYSDVHSQHNTQKQLRSLQPAWNPLRRRLRCLPCLHRGFPALSGIASGNRNNRCKNLGPYLKPGNLFRSRLRPGNRLYRRPRLGSRARGKDRRYQFRLLGHSLVTRAVPDFSDP
jgi:hypothetical protein